MDGRALKWQLARQEAPRSHRLGSGHGRAERGASAVEFALLVPVLITLLAGVLEFGRVLDAWVVVSNAAREGGRLAALGRPATDVQDAVMAYLAAAFGSRADVQLPARSAIQVINAQGMTGDPVTVIVPAYVEIDVPLVRDLLLTDPYTVTGRVEMRLE